MTMIERVARAICCYDSHDGPCKCKDKCTNPYSYGAARAAIEAMREPTEAVLEPANFGWSPDTHPTIWHAMIDAALTEEPTK